MELFTRVKKRKQPSTTTVPAVLPDGQPEIAATKFELTTKHEGNQEIRAVGDVTIRLAAAAFANGSFRNSYLLQFLHDRDRIFVAKAFRPDVIMYRFKPDGQKYSTIDRSGEVMLAYQDILAQHVAASTCEAFSKLLRQQKIPTRVECIPRSR